MPSELFQTKWTCTVCNREMGLLSRRSHLQGKPHLARVAASESTVTNELGNGNDNENGNSAGTPPAVWTCTTCNCQMPISSRETHVQGQSHRKKASAPSSASANNELRSKLEYWTCMICDCHVPLGSQEMHLKGKPHLKKVARAGAGAGASSSVVRDPSPVVFEPPTASPSLSSQNWTCEPCGRQMNVQNREQHLQGKQHKAAVEQNGIENVTDTGAGFWICTVCSVSMNANHRGRHLRGDMHATWLARRRSGGDDQAGGSGVTGRGEGPGRRRGPARGGGPGRGGPGGDGPGRGGSNGQGRGGRGGPGGGGGGPGRGGGRPRRGGGGPGRGGGGGGPSRGGRGRGRGQYRRDWSDDDDVLGSASGEDLLDFIAELGYGRIPGGGGCSSGEDYYVERPWKRNRFYS